MAITLTLKHFWNAPKPCFSIILISLVIQVLDNDDYAERMIYHERLREGNSGNLHCLCYTLESNN